jgi:hypothetical protein
MKPAPCFTKCKPPIDRAGVGWITCDIPKRLEFDLIIDVLTQTPKLPEMAAKAPPVGRVAPCQSNDWLGA